MEHERARGRWAKAAAAADGVFDDQPDDDPTLRLGEPGGGSDDPG